MTADAEGAVDGMLAEQQTRATTLALTIAATVGLDPSPTERDWLETGITAGIAAATEILAERGMLRAAP